MRLAKKLQALAPPKRATKDADLGPRKFIDWLAWVGVVPHPGQAELARVAFDGCQPVDAALAEKIFGPIDFASLSVALRRVVTIVAGGRGGKTYLLIALRLVFGMCVRDLSPLAAGEEAFATVVAPNDDLRQQAVNYALGICRAKPELRALLRLPKGSKPDSSPSEFGLYRPDFDRVVTFTGAVATRGGYGVRGKWHTDLALDECAFFRDSTAKVNDKDIYEAGVSRILPGGQCILGSTPWAMGGLLFEFFRDNFGKPTTCLAAHAPTLLLNPTPAITEIVEMERKRDPENARREYDAEFLQSGSTIFFESTTLDGSFVETPFVIEPNDSLSAGGDFGFRADSSALLKAALRRTTWIEEDGTPKFKDTVHIYGGVECRPDEDAPLKPSETVEAFANCIAGECSYLMADQHYREAIAEHLEKFNLVYIPAPTVPADTYVRARMLFRETRIVVHKKNLPDGVADRLQKQLREVQGRPTAGGGMSIVHPKWSAGGHGDLAAALVLAVWQLTGERVEPPPPPEGSPEWELAAKKARVEYFQREDNPYWQAKAHATDRGKNAFWRRGR